MDKSAEAPSAVDVARLATGWAEASTRPTRQATCEDPLTGLATEAYFRAKVATGYLMALCTLVLLYIAGLTLGVRLPAARWLEMTAFILIGLVPFVPLGILMGHVLSVESIGPAMGGITAVFAPLAGRLLEFNKCPDFVVNRGHYAGTKYIKDEPELSDSDKRALIEFVKTF